MCKIQVDDSGEHFVVLPEAIWKQLEADDWCVGDELGYETEKGQLICLGSGELAYLEPAKRLNFCSHFFL